MAIFGSGTGTGTQSFWRDWDRVVWVLPGEKLMGLGTVLGQQDDFERDWVAGTGLGTRNWVPRASLGLTGI